MLRYICCMQSLIRKKCRSVMLILVRLSDDLRRMRQYLVNRASMRGYVHWHIHPDKCRSVSVIEMIKIFLFVCLIYVVYISPCQT
jgi:hypothetical protein